MRHIWIYANANRWLLANKDLIFGLFLTQSYHMASKTLNSYIQIWHIKTYVIDIKPGMKHLNAPYLNLCKQNKMIFSKKINVFRSLQILSDGLIYGAFFLELDSLCPLSFNRKEQCEIFFSIYYWVLPQIEVRLVLEQGNNERLSFWGELSL